MTTMEYRRGIELIRRCALCGYNISFQDSELKTLECDVLNPDLLINLEIKFMWRTSNI